MKIAITGHSPDSFLVSHYSFDSIKRIASDVVAIFKREHKNDLVFNLGGTLGTDQWVGSECIDQNVKFCLYLSFLPGIQSEFWKQEQIDELNRQMKLAIGINIVDPKTQVNTYNYYERNVKMIDESDFVVAFWVGKRQGQTFDAIKYALDKSKFVLNALNNLKPLFKEDLEKGWTPNKDDE